MSATTMKERYRGTEIAGHRWTGYIDGFHIFEKRVGNDWCWSSVLLTTEDIDDGSAEWMIENGWTRKWGGVGCRD